MQTTVALVIFQRGSDQKVDAKLDQSLSESTQLGSRQVLQLQHREVNCCYSMVPYTIAGKVVCAIVIKSLLWPFTHSTVIDAEYQQKS